MSCLDKYKLTTSLNRMKLCIAIWSTTVLDPFYIWLLQLIYTEIQLASKQSKQAITIHDKSGLYTHNITHRNDTRNKQFLYQPMRAQFFLSAAQHLWFKNQSKIKVGNKDYSDWSEENHQDVSFWISPLNH